MQEKLDFIWQYGNIGIYKEGFVMQFNNKNPQRTKLIVEIPQEFHRALKGIALKYNVTLRSILTEMIVKLIKHEEELDKPLEGKR